MPRIVSFFLLTLMCCFNVNLITAQSLRGTVQDADTESTPKEAVISIFPGDIEERIANDGVFYIKIPAGDYTLNISAPGFDTYSQSITLSVDETVDLGRIWMSPTISSSIDEGFDIISLSEDDLADGDSDNQNVSSLLSASRDVFIDLAAFNLNAGRYRQRGYDNTANTRYLNGAPINSLVDGWFSFSITGGLNDVMRNINAEWSLRPSEFAFGGLSGSANVSLRASDQRSQTRASYAISNRSYRNRIMATHSSGLMDNGWAYSVSGSRRWADEGYVAGTFYDAYSYFGAVSKEFNSNNKLHFTIFGSPQKRGRSGPSTQEMLDLAGTNYYNPYWGFQNGEKRNSRTQDTHLPIGLLTYDLSLNDNTFITTTVLYQSGKQSRSRLDWYNAPDPRPDYYRKLPSAFDSEVTQQQVATILAADESKRQLDFDYFFNANRNNTTTIKDVDGISGNDVSGNLSNFVIEDSHNDITKLAFATNISTTLSESLALNGGLSYTKENVQYYRELEDLLGGDFYIDLDKFAERDFPGNIDFLQNDLNNPNRLIREGDQFGDIYDLNTNKANIWGALELSMSKIDAHISGSLSNASFHRDGLTKNGKFPDNSFGKSETHSFTNFETKAGITYKLNGRNYIYANGYFGTKAPFARNAFVSPRTRDQIISNLTSEKAYSGEIGYNLRYPSLKGRATLYYTKIEDQSKVRSFYHDDFNSFVNFILTGVDKIHTGVEAAFEAKITSTLSFGGLASVGQFLYDSRPNATVSQDNTSTLLSENVTIYQQDYYIPGSPQSAFTAELNYRSPKFWFASLGFNYFTNIYLDFNPLRRTVDGISPIMKDDNPLLFGQILDQEKLPADYTLDFFGGKSWKIGGNFIYLNAGVNNILDNRDFRTGGFEQSRFDFEDKDVGKFPNNYFYTFGRNYFISLAIRL